MYEILKVLEERHVTPTREMTVTLAKCLHCGNVDKILEQNVRRANRQQRKHCAKCIDETFHNMTNTRIWRIWKGMVERTTKQTSIHFKNYGGRGIGVSDEWLVFENFYRDMGPTYKDDLTLERIDNSKGYSKENCRWATAMEQQSNKRNNRVLVYQGEKMHLAEFCRKVGVSRGAITVRLNAGMTPEQAVLDYQNSNYPKNRKSRKSTI